MESDGDDISVKKLLQGRISPHGEILHFQLLRGSLAGQRLGQQSILVGSPQPFTRTPPHVRQICLLFGGIGRFSNQVR